MIIAIADKPLTRKTLTDIIGEYGENAYVMIGLYRAIIKDIPENTTVKVVDVEKEGGRLWGIVKSNDNSTKYDYIAFLAKTWRVDLVDF